MDANTIYCITAANTAILVLNIITYWSMSKYSIQRLTRMGEISQEMSKSIRRATELNDKFVKAVTDSQEAFIGQIVTACRSSRAKIHVNFVVQGFRQASVVTEKPPEAYD